MRRRVYSESFASALIESKQTFCLEKHLSGSSSYLLSHYFLKLVINILSSDITGRELQRFSKISGMKGWSCLFIKLHSGPNALCALLKERLVCQQVNRQAVCGLFAELQN